MRSLIILQNELSLLATVTGDYAGWDDTYAFVRDGNQAFFESNLVASTFAKQRLNLLLIVNTKGKIIYGTGFDLGTNRTTPLSQAMRHYLHPGCPLFTHADTESVLTGLLALPEGLMMFASRPILTSDYRGPIRGTLIMGRYLDVVESDRLAELTRLNIRYQSLAPQTVPQHRDRIVPFAIPEKRMEFQTLNTDIIQGSAILHDVFGRPVMKLVVKQPRVLLKHGLNSLAFLIFCGVLTTVAFGGIVFLLLEKLVLRRLRMMSDEVDHIGISGASLHRVSV